MDIRKLIGRWEHEIQENPSILILVIITSLALAFIATLCVDAFRKRKLDRRQLK